MHIFLAILAILSAIAVWSWRLQMLGRAARHGRDAVKTAANLPRKMRFEHKARKTAVDITSDPREAASAIILAVAQAGDGVLEEEPRDFAPRLADLFGVTDAEASELAGRGDWLVRQVRTRDSLVRRMTEVVVTQVDYEAMDALSEQLEDIALENGEPNEEQVRLIGIYLKRAGIAAG